MSGSIIEIINKSGVFFCDHALRMLIQSSVLIAALLIIDLIIRKRVKAVFRYFLWLIIFVKLVTPTTLSFPTGIGYWLGDLVPDKAASKEITIQPKTENEISSLQLSNAEYTEPASNIPINSINIETIPVENTPRTETPMITPAAHSIRIKGILFLAWVISELILIALFLQRTFFVRRIIVQSKPASIKLQEILKESCQAIGLRKKIELKVSQSLKSPAACGLLKPKIIMPASLLKCFTSEKLRTTMLHELAHIKRKDIWINSLQTFLQIFYFYNPFLWIANIIVRRIREQAVDETVLVYLGDKADTYSSTLVDIAEIAFSKPSLGLNMIGVVESKKALTERIRHILSKPFPKTVKLGFTSFIAIALAAFVLIPMAKANNTPTASDELIDKLANDAIDGNNRKDSADVNNLNSTGSTIAAKSGESAFNKLIATLNDSLKNEDVKQTIAHLGNFDDDVFASTRITDLGNANKQRRLLTLLWRVRKLYAIGQKNPELVVPELRQAYKESFNSWPEAYKQREDDYNNNKMVLSEPDACMRVQHICFVSTYLLAEFGDYSFLPQLSQQFKMHHIWPPPATPSPVAPALTFYAMHRLASSYPRESLSEEAIKALEDYLAAAKDFVLPPEQIETTAYIGFYADNGTEPNSLGRVSSIVMPLYPLKFINGTQMEDGNGIISEQLDKLFNKLDAFVQIVYHTEDNPSSGAVTNNIYADPKPNNTEKAMSIEPDSDNYMALLPNGVTIELLGVCKHPSEGKQWWKPDGSILEKAPYDKLDRTIEADESSKVREFAIHFSGQNLKDANYRLYRIDGQVQTTYAQRLSHELLAIRAVFSKNKKSTSISIGVSAGQWETRAVSDGKREINSSLSDGDVTFRKAVQSNGKAAISVMARGILISTDGRILCENRIIAKDHKGNILTGKMTSGGIRGGTGVYAYEFDLSLEQISLFEYQTRPYYWIDFENVALEPEEKPNVKVRISTSVANSNPKVMTQMELQHVETNTLTPPVWITFLPANPIRSLADYQHSQKVESLSSGNVKSESFELEIRTASDNKRIARFIYDNYPIIDSRWGCKLNKQQIQEIGAIEDGTYSAAMYINGLLCSNIAEFTIDSKVDLSSEPTLKLVPLPLGVGQVLPSLGIIVTGPNPPDSELEYSTIAFPELFVDGIERKIKVMKWAGPDGILQTNAQAAMILDLENYTPAITLNEPHEVWAKLGDYQSPTVVIPSKDIVDISWYGSTDKLQPALDPINKIEGTIIGSEGKPASYNIILTGEKGETFRTTSDQDGKYEFSNILTGHYSLRCNTKNQNNESLAVKNFLLPYGQKMILNLNFQASYSYSGRVTYEDGTPAADLSMMSTCEDRLSMLYNYTKTDKEGRFSFSMPLKTGISVGLELMPNGYTTKEKIYNGIMAERDDLDFVLIKSSGTDSWNNGAFFHRLTN